MKGPFLPGSVTASASVAGPAAAGAGLPDVSAAADRNIYSISRLNREVRSLLESGIGQVWVQGELTNLSRPASGHWYFTLKDRDAQLRCAMFRVRNNRAGFLPSEGQLVLARGRVSLYEPRGDYQLLVEQLEDAGLGALQRAYEQLRQRLAAEGLFAAERKRPLPQVPRCIGVITSPSGAAIRDILHILARRFPAARVIIYGVPVQGAAAAPAIVAALDLAGRRAECDVLILARGGGSLEDLWAFNDERVARAIHRASLPIVTGIGHEIDFTIADFIADVRAPTPSAAAELVVPDASAWLQRLEQLQTRLRVAVRRGLQADGVRLTRLSGRFSAAARRALQSERVRLTQLQARFSAAARRALQSERLRLAALLRRLDSAHPGARLRALSQRLDELEGRLQFALQAQLTGDSGRLQTLARALQAVSPLATLERGFAVITRSADGALVTSTGQLTIGERFEARLARGVVHAEVRALSRGASDPEDS